MIKHKVIQFLLFLAAVSIQMLLVPLIGEDFFLVNALLCLSIIFSLKETRIESLVWSFFLGGLTDLLLFQHIGYYGISFVISSYILGFLSQKMVIGGFFPILLIACLSFILVVLISICLMVVFQGRVDVTILITPFFWGLLITPVATLAFEFIYKNAEKFVIRK